jgi:hypothetical protein
LQHRGGRGIARGSPTRAPQDRDSHRNCPLPYRSHSARPLWARERRRRSSSLEESAEKEGEGRRGIDLGNLHEICALRSVAWLVVIRFGVSFYHSKS